MTYLLWAALYAAGLATPKAYALAKAWLVKKATD
jgi:hypothetical protein